MTLTLELPPELEERARRIPDLQDRVITFVRELADDHHTEPRPVPERAPTNLQELEEWRKRRYSPRARWLVEQSRLAAEQAIQEGVTREEAAQHFEELHARICEKL